MRPLMTQCGDKHTELSACCTGSVSIGFIHAMPGDMKSFKSSAERMALIGAAFGGVYRRELGYCKAAERSVGETRGQNTEVCDEQERKKSPGKYQSRTTAPMRGERPRDISQSRMRRLSISLHFQATNLRGKLCPGSPRYPATLHLTCERQKSRQK
jgi:hypothetical protein